MIRVETLIWFIISVELVVLAFVSPEASPWMLWVAYVLNMALMDSRGKAEVSTAKDELIESYEERIKHMANIIKSS